jgi:hypothetical protein
VQHLDRLNRVFKVLRDLDIHPDFWQLQNEYYQLSRAKTPDGSPMTEELVVEWDRLGENLGVRAPIRSEPEHLPMLEAHPPQAEPARKPGPYDSKPADTVNPSTVAGKLAPDAPQLHGGEPQPQAAPPIDAARKETAPIDTAAIDTVATDAAPLNTAPLDTAAKPEGSAKS